MANKKLQVKNLQISFRTQGGILKAVRNISFDLYQGETLAIVGESGSGKSVTSKAIIGILSGNSIVEGGEILYDGMDLLKIDEENFHKIRGDKIAMIFQDPLSSLNPIMRVGKQLTEAMILNGKARQRNSRREFNSHLGLLKKDILEIEQRSFGVKAKDDFFFALTSLMSSSICSWIPSSRKISDSLRTKLSGIGKKAAMCDVFNAFCVESIHLEKAYDDADNAAISLKNTLEEDAFLLEKKQKVDLKRQLSLCKSQFKKGLNPYVISDTQKANEYIAKLDGYLKISKPNEEQMAEIVSSLNEMASFVGEQLKNEHPNFFRLGYYEMVNPDFDPLTVPNIKELDEMTLKALDDGFMKEFLEIGSKGVTHSHEKSIEARRTLLPKLKEFRTFLESDENFKNKKVVNSSIKKLSKEVLKAIDHLSIIRASDEYSFGISIKHEYDYYQQGIKNNPKNQAKYEKSKAKWDKLMQEGKAPTWQVIPPYIIDLELSKRNVLKILDDLIAHYERDLASTSFDSSKEILDLVDFLKEHASRFVHRVTKGVAKARALELMKEVGIPQPHIRFKQYPFEFSGGMRQRIVIAIALSANPDILICDEPTTALDVTIQAQILELINKIKAERNLSVIFITHDLGVVANMADRVAVMYAGKIVEYGTADDVFYDPKHPYTWALLASMPDLETSDKLEAIPGTPPNMIYPPIGDAFAERNKYALAIDFEMEPPLFEISETHYAATWLLHPSAPKVEPPKIIKDRIARMKKEAKEYHE